MNSVGTDSIVGLASMSNVNTNCHISTISIAVGSSAGSSLASRDTMHGQTSHSDEDDIDDGMISSPGSFDDSSSFIGPDDVTTQLAAAGGWPGPVGVAAAAAIASAKKRKRHHCFELNPSIRKRQQTRLLRKLKLTIDEFSTRVGQQAVVVVATPSKSGNNFKCFGAKPLEDVVKTLRQMIMSELENALAQQAPPPPPDDPSLYELPPLVVDGIPTPVEKMTQAQLRAFIPLMLKYSTGRGKPGWGKDSTRPPWWPKDVPWANVRMDARSEDQKQKISWTTALRQIVLSCYKYHGRDDLLPAFSEEDDKSQGNVQPSTPQSVFPGTVVQTISNPDGTVSIFQVDPSNPIIHLADGTTAHIQGMAQIQDLLCSRKKLEITTCSESSLEGSDGTVAIDLNGVADAALSNEGTILFTSEDGTQVPVNVSGSYPVSGMITVPLPVYQTVVANIQSADGQHLQVVTPLIQVPKVEPSQEVLGVHSSNDHDIVTGSISSQQLQAAQAIIASHTQCDEDDDDDDRKMKV